MIGWRVEFRPMEAQLTDFENAVVACFVSLLARALRDARVDAAFDARAPLSQLMKCDGGSPAPKALMDLQSKILELKKSRTSHRSLTPKLQDHHGHDARGRVISPAISAPCWLVTAQISEAKLA